MEKNLKVIRGDTFSFGVEFEGLNADLDSAYFTIKESFSGENIVQKSLGDGITKVADGKYKVRVAPTDTVNLNSKNYYYDFQIGVDDDIYTLLYGMIELLPDVTRGVSV